MTPEERASRVCDEWEKPHIPRRETPRLNTLIAAAIRDAEREVWLVFTTYSWFEGEPLGVFNTEELAEDFVQREKKRMPSNKPRKWKFEVNSPPET